MTETAQVRYQMKRCHYETQLPPNINNFNGYLLIYRLIYHFVMVNVKYGPFFTFNAFGARARKYFSTLNSWRQLDFTQFRVNSRMNVHMNNALCITIATNLVKPT